MITLSSERLRRLDKPAPPAAGETSAAVADKSERPCGRGKLTPPAAGETGEAVVDKPKQLSRPGKPVPPAAGETSAAAADTAERLRIMAGYKIPRCISPIRKCYLKNFQALPATLDGCIVRAPETTQERVLFGILMDAGMVLSGREAKDYNRPHFKLQRKREERRLYSD